MVGSVLNTRTTQEGHVQFVSYVFFVTQCGFKDSLVSVEGISFSRTLRTEAYLVVLDRPETARKGVSSILRILCRKRQVWHDVKLSSVRNKSSFGFTYKLLLSSQSHWVEEVEQISLEVTSETLVSSRGIFEDRSCWVVDSCITECSIVDRLRIYSSERQVHVQSQAIVQCCLRKVQTGIQSFIAYSIYNTVVISVVDSSQIVGATEATRNTRVGGVRKGIANQFISPVGITTEVSSTSCNEFICRKYRNQVSSLVQCSK